MSSIRIPTVLEFSDNFYYIFVVLCLLSQSRRVKIPTVINRRKEERLFNWQPCTRQSHVAKSSQITRSSRRNLWISYRSADGFTFLTRQVYNLFQDLWIRSPYFGGEGWVQSPLVLSLAATATNESLYFIVLLLFCFGPFSGLQLCICCVFRPASGCCAYSKAGRTI